MRCILSFVVLYCTILTALAVPISPPPVPDLKQTDPTEGYAYINDIHLAPEDSTGARLLSGSSSPGAVYRHGDCNVQGGEDNIFAVTITVWDALAIEFTASSGCVASNCDDTSAHISSNVNATDVPTGH
ncbi:hypothetical protein RhiXN_00081 [Rhizoctonia solani]|uniref:Uncharacterized protein n=1 Tax=Rhizoctonia solani TaxID=456999 RepID=A0A8H8NU48_9AGAM|nr:uncharacterized protein RhiXN_00081 [Rhizoctonia solani]QRW18675.1 hypothetical protein RhiXN_00081 [Rhizoctonia solani]